ncbi:hypothetical protein LOTGIDRAFT_162345 [Lottia gigantea]|uniref:dihydrofolate reductase n=1 Tax=Lottia gigantea TaxID=225164 RepID=V3ZNC2_LOTGI|nr:hypothetical protein LOTGIDRAFT_162345 [Lottia gigantea]ESO92868.1 hypothetical protein LOTGIDRAFT_162345 [Lottia gigantea]
MKIVTAMCNESRGIGFKNALPWPKLPGDYKHYRGLVAPKYTGEKTANIKGRLTWLSTDHSESNQPGVINIVITTLPKESLKSSKVHYTSESLSEAHQLALECGIKEDNIWIMGGHGIYKDAIAHPECSHLYLTRIYKEFDSDVTLPAFEHQFQKKRDLTIPDNVQEENGVRYQFEVYERT